MIQFCTSDSPRILRVGEDRGHQLVLHLRQRRVHHQDQPDGDEQVGVLADGQGFVEPLDADLEQVADGDAERHGGEDPDRQVAVEK